MKPKARLGRMLSEKVPSSILFKLGIQKEDLLPLRVNSLLEYQFEQFDAFVLEWYPCLRMEKREGGSGSWEREGGVESTFFFDPLEAQILP